MSDKEVRTSSDLIRWLKMLALPTRAKLGLALIMRLAHQRHLVVQATPDHSVSGVVFTKSLHEDFLLEPAQRLYFAQDLSFFIRGMLEASIQHA